MKRENEMRETYKSLRENRERLAKEELAKINEANAARQSIIDKYRAIKEDKESIKRNKQRFLEDARNNEFATVLKAIYITALEAETLTDQGILLAESMVDNYIKENGGASKILGKVGNNTYFLSRITKIVEDAAQADLAELLEADDELDLNDASSDGKSGDSDDDEPSESEGKALDAAKEFINGASKEEIDEFIRNIKKSATDNPEYAKIKADEAQQRADEAKKKADAASGTDSSDALADTDEEDDVDEKSEDSGEGKSDETPSKDESAEGSGAAEESEETKEEDKSEEDSDDEKSDDKDEEESEKDEDEDKDSDEDSDKDEDEDSKDSDDDSDEDSDEDDATDVIYGGDSDDEDDDSEDSEEDEEEDEEEDSSEDDETVVDSEDSDEDVDEELGEKIDDGNPENDEENLDGEGENNGKVFEDLDKEQDVKKAVELIRTRVADAEKSFIQKNAEDKKKIDELLNKISDNIKAVEDINDKNNPKSKIAEEHVRMYKREIDNIRDYRPLTIFEAMTRKLSASIIKDDVVREEYMDNDTGRVDTGLVVESAKVMYGFIETLNTLQLEKVDASYIKKVIDNM